MEISRPTPAVPFQISTGVGLVRTWRESYCLRCQFCLLRLVTACRVTAFHGEQRGVTRSGDSALISIYYRNTITTHPATFSPHRDFPAYSSSSFPDRDWGRLGENLARIVLPPLSILSPMPSNRVSRNRFPRSTERNPRQFLEAPRATAHR